jgi:hypothetical protein
VPEPLPPNPPIVLDGGLQQKLESAGLALGRLDASSALLTGKTRNRLFVYDGYLSLLSGGTEPL